MKAGWVLAAITAPPIVFSGFWGLSIEGVIRITDGSQITPIFPVYVLVWVLSFLTPVALPWYVSRRLKRMDFLSVLAVEVGAYAAWLVFVYFERANFDSFSLTYFLPPTVTAAAVYALVMKRTTLGDSLRGTPEAHASVTSD